MVNFKSLNFKLAVINELIILGYFTEKIEEIEDGIESGKYSEYYKKCSKMEYSGPHPEIYEYFKNLDITDKQLDEITSLSFDGGDDIYLLIAHNWDGEDDLFTVDTLEDAVLLKNLERLEFTFLLKVTDASPLLKLKKLVYVDTDDNNSINDPVTIGKLIDNGVEVDSAGDEDFEECQDDNEMDELEMDEQYSLAQEYLWDRDDPEKALEILDRLVKIKNDDSDIWLEKGNAHDFMGSSDEAEKAWRKAVEIDPENCDACYNLASLFKERGNNIDALAYIDMALENGMEAGEAYHIKAQLEGLAGNDISSLTLLKKALSLYQERAEEEPDDYETIFQIACVKSLLGEEKEALEFLKLAVSMDRSLGKRAMEDSDFERLREKPEFKKLVN